MVHWLVLLVNCNRIGGGTLQSSENFQSIPQHKENEEIDFSALIISKKVSLHIYCLLRFSVTASNYWLYKRLGSLL